MSKPPIVFVHGLFVTRACWDPWVERFTARGHRCLTPAYPGRERPVAELRVRHPDAAVAALTLPTVLAQLQAVIAGLERPPIVIGHSFGGLLTQLLLARRFGAAGVAIDSVPPPGTLALPWSFVRSTFPALNPFARGPYLMSLAHFRYAFVNRQPPAEQERIWREQVVPESRRLARAALGGAARIDFARPRPPLLIAAGEHDHIMPAAVNRANFRRYRRTPARTDYHEFAGRDHYLIGAPGWQEVADHVLAWAERAIAESPGAPATASPAHGAVRAAAR